MSYPNLEEWISLTNGTTHWTTRFSASSPVTTPPYVSNPSTASPIRHPYQHQFHSCYSLLSLKGIKGCLQSARHGCLICRQARRRRIYFPLTLPLKGCVLMVTPPQLNPTSDHRPTFHGVKPTDSCCELRHLKVSVSPLSLILP